jgi:O-antigen/teichoic acid export membrane protein
MHFQADKVIAGVLLGTSYVTFYTVPSSLVQRMMDVTSRLAYVTYPLVSELQGRNDLDRIRDVYLNASRIMLALATAITLPLLIFGNRFLATWMGPAFERNTGSVVQLSTLALYLITMTQVPSLVLNGLGHVRITGLFSVAGAGLYFALMYPLTSIMGVSGIAASLLASRLVMVPIFLVYANRKVIGLPMVKLLGAVYIKPVSLGLFMWLLLVSLPLERVHNIFLLIGTMAVTGALYLGVAIGIGIIKPGERQAMISYLYALT